jgi:maltokinase
VADRVDPVLDALARLGLEPADRTVVPVAVDQTNESFVVGGEYVVKLRPEPLAEDDVALVRLERLRAAGAGCTPTFHGVTGRALVTSYVPGAVDGWTWCVGEARAALGVDDVDVPGAPVGTTPARPGWASELGALTARMHSALVVADGLVLGHGDFHVGQVLRDPDGRLWVIDFDGNPVLPAEERAAPRPTAYDVAGMLLSLENVGHVVRHHALRQGVALADEPVAAWTEQVQDGFLSAYRADGALDESLLEGYVAEQIQRELAYADAHLPRWRYVPEAALARRARS